MGFVLVALLGVVLLLELGLELGIVLGVALRLVLGVRRLRLSLGLDAPHGAGLGLEFVIVLGAGLVLGVILKTYSSSPFWISICAVSGVGV